MPKKILYFIPILGILLALCLVFCNVGVGSLTNAHSVDQKDETGLDDSYFTTYDIENYMGTVD